MIENSVHLQLIGSKWKEIKFKKYLFLSSWMYQKRRKAFQPSGDFSVSWEFSTEKKNNFWRGVEKASESSVRQGNVIRQIRFHRSPYTCKIVHIHEARACRDHLLLGPPGPVPSGGWFLSLGFFQYVSNSTIINSSMCAYASSRMIIVQAPKLLECLIFLCLDLVDWIAYSKSKH